MRPEAGVPSSATDTPFLCCAAVWLDLLDRGAECGTDFGQFVGALQVHPELGRGTKEPRQPHRHVGADTALLEDDVVHRLRLDGKRLCQCISAYPQRTKEFFLKDFARMNRPCSVSTPAKTHCRILPSL